MNKVGNLTIEEVYNVLKDVSKFREVILVRRELPLRSLINNVTTGTRTISLNMDEDITLKDFENYDEIIFPGNKISNGLNTTTISVLFGCSPSSYVNINWILNDEAPDWFKEKYGSYEAYASKYVEKKKDTVRVYSKHDPHQEFSIYITIITPQFEYKFTVEDAWAYTFGEWMKFVNDEVNELNFRNEFWIKSVKDKYIFITMPNEGTSACSTSFEYDKKPIQEALKNTLINAEQKGCFK